MHGWRNGGCFQKAVYFSSAKVADANCFGLACLDKRFHCLVRIDKIDVVSKNLAILSWSKLVAALERIRL